MQAINNTPRPGTLRLRPPLRRTLAIAGIARKNDASTPASSIDPIATLKDRWTGNVLGMLAAASLVGSSQCYIFKKKTAVTPYPFGIQSVKSFYIFFLSVHCSQWYCGIYARGISTRVQIQITNDKSI